MTTAFLILVGLLVVGLLAALAWDSVAFWRDTRPTVSVELVAVPAAPRDFRDWNADLDLKDAA